MKNTQSKDVTLIVGAGITGLTAAYKLSMKGESCLLLEKENKVGGLCRSYRLDDITFDLGPHIFLYNPYLEAEKFMMDILKDEKIIKRRFRFAIYIKNRYWKFPVNILDILLYPWKYKKQFLKSFLKKGHKQLPDEDIDVSVEQEIAGKVGRDYYDDIFDPMLMAKTLLHGNKLHRDWVMRVDRDVNNCKEPFKEFSRAGLFQKFLSTLYQTYYYPYHGYEVFAQRLWEKYQQAGGETILDCGHIRFESEDDRLTRVIVQDKAFNLKNVIWTASINKLNDIMGNNLKRVKYVKTIIVFLTYNQKKRVRRPYVYVYYPEGDMVFNRVYYPSSIYREHTPQGREGICLELNYMDELDGLSDNEIIQRTVEDVEKRGFFKKSELRNQKILRLGECMPLYELDYYRKMQETYRDVHYYKNLYSVGRQGGYFFCLTPAAVRQGIKIARHLLQEEVNHEQ